MDRVFKKHTQASVFKHLLSLIISFLPCPVAHFASGPVPVGVGHNGGKKKVSVAEQNRTVSPKLKPFVKTLTWLPTRVLTSCSHSTDSHWNRLFAMCVLVSMITVLHCPFPDDISITIISTPLPIKSTKRKLHIFIKG